jgi:hypothetical protein
VTDAYREQPPKPPDPYLVAWADLRRRRRLSFVSGVPVLLASIGCLFLPEYWLALSLLLFATVASFACGRSVARFPCPHCGKRFSTTPTWRPPWNCDYCGIAVGTPKDPGAPPL